MHPNQPAEAGDRKPGPEAAGDHASAPASGEGSASQPEEASASEEPAAHDVTTGDPARQASGSSRLTAVLSYLTPSGRLKPAVHSFDPSVTTPIRVALALIYFHFGFLKFFPDLSSAEMLSTQTILRLRMGMDASDALAYLAVFECLIGLAFVARVPMKWLFPVFLAHMAGTLAPLVLLPELTFKIAPFAPTLEGQYIIKNAIVIAAGWTLYRADRAQESQAQQPQAQIRSAPA